MLKKLSKKLGVDQGSLYRVCSHSSAVKLAEQCSEIIQHTQVFYWRQANQAADERCEVFERLRFVFGDIKAQRVVDESPAFEALPPLSANLIDELTEFVINLKRSVGLV